MNMKKRVFNLDGSKFQIPHNAIDFPGDVIGFDSSADDSDLWGNGSVSEESYQGNWGPTVSTTYHGAFIAF